MINNQYIFKN